MKRLLFLILLLPFAIINISAQENLDLETKPRLGHIEIPVKTKQDLKGGTYWITINSGIRHNPTCRWYKNSKGRPCTIKEGRACKVCGG